MLHPRHAHNGEENEHSNFKVAQGTLKLFNSVFEHSLRCALQIYLSLRVLLGYPVWHRSTCSYWLGDPLAYPRTKLIEVKNTMTNLPDESETWHESHMLSP